MHDLISQRFKMHFDPSLRFVVKTAVNETCDIEVKAVNAIQMKQRIAVEGRGHTERVVIGCVKERFALLAIDTDHQTASRESRAIRLNLPQENYRISGREVSDARTRIEERDWLNAKRAFQIETTGKIRHHAEHFDFRKIHRHF